MVGRLIFVENGLERFTAASQRSTVHTYPGFLGTETSVQGRGQLDLSVGCFSEALQMQTLYHVNHQLGATVRRALVNNRWRDLVALTQCMWAVA